MSETVSKVASEVVVDLMKRLDSKLEMITALMIATSLVLAIYEPDEAAELIAALGPHMLANSTEMRNAVDKAGMH